MHDKITKKDIILNVKKAIGNLNKVMEMVEEDKYCVDIATQVNASMGLLKSVNIKLLENHLKCCGPKFLTSKDPEVLDNFVKEITRAWDVTNRK